MKTKLPKNQAHARERERARDRDRDPITHQERFAARGVKYQWSTPDGTVHHGHTVVLARTRSGLKSALRQFWTLHPHVSPFTA